jgi:hypothetical protein
MTQHTTPGTSPEINLRHVITRPTALVPIVMSIAALVILFLALAFGIGVSNDGDEGTAARLWQLLMIGQMPIVAFFAISWVPRVPRYAIAVMAVQLAVALSSALPVFLLQL